MVRLTLSHSESPKLWRVFAFLSAVGLTDHSNMTLAVYRGYKTI